MIILKCASESLKTAIRFKSSINGVVISTDLGDYVLFAFIDSKLLANGIMSRAQLIDAIAVGQFTPGPVFSSVTFIGYQINGISGALVSTFAIFIPSFVFVALLNPLVKKNAELRVILVFSGCC